MRIMLSDCLILTYLHKILASSELKANTILLFLNMWVSHIAVYVGIDYLHLVLTWFKFFHHLATNLMPVSHSTQEIPVLPTDSAVLQYLSAQNELLFEGFHLCVCVCMCVCVCVCVCVMGRT